MPSKPSLQAWQRSDEANNNDRRKMLVMPGKKLRGATAEDGVGQGRPVHEYWIV
jgi:hypothetical protein